MGASASRGRSESQLGAGLERAALPFCRGGALKRFFSIFQYYYGITE